MSPEGVVDFFAVYLVQRDWWYIVPYGAVRGSAGSIQITPVRAGHKYVEYLEAWNLLRE